MTGNAWKGLSVVSRFRDTQDGYGPEEIMAVFVEHLDAVHFVEKVHTSDPDYTWGIRSPEGPLVECSECGRISELHGLGSGDMALCEPCYEVAV